MGALLIYSPRFHRESDLFLLDVQDLHAGTEGWLVFDVTAASNHWLVDRKYNLGLRLYVETDDGEPARPPCTFGANPCGLEASPPLLVPQRVAGVAASCCNFIFSAVRETVGASSQLSLQGRSLPKALMLMGFLVWAVITALGLMNALPGGILSAVLED